MWKPNQLINDDVVITLRQAGFSESQLEFLGWLSYCANTLNNSRNPAKAAHTLLAKESMLSMVEKFMAKKKESVAPKQVADHDKVDRLFSKFDQWAERVEAESTPRQPSDQEIADSQED